MKGQEGDKVRKNKRLEKYGISQDRHMELRYFCKQYPQKKRTITRIYDVLKRCKLQRYAFWQSNK